jgi:hypothetical protein
MIASGMIIGWFLLLCQVPWLCIGIYSGELEKGMKEFIKGD